MCPAVIGSRPEPAISPSITALIIAPLCLASASMSSKEMGPRLFLDRLGKPRAVEAAVAHRDFFGHQIGAAGRGDHGGAIRRHESRRNATSGFQQFARQHDVDIADAGCERQHRLLAAQLAGGHRHDLDVIGGCAGALCDARDRGRLHREAALRCGRYDPVGEHAAALAAERGDQDGDGLGLGHARASARGLSQPMTARRTRCSVRSHQFGLRMTSAR